MSVLKAYGKDVISIFHLIGNKENDITKSICWIFQQCPEVLNMFVKEIFDTIKYPDINVDETIISFQKYDCENNGITDIEITDNENFYIIVEAKYGWEMPGCAQLKKYSERKDFKNSKVKHRAIVTISECKSFFADLQLKKINVGVPLKHISWEVLINLINDTRLTVNNKQKYLIDEFAIYLKEIAKMQKKESNWVYVVALSSLKLENINLTSIDIVKKYNKYFCPVGNGWPKEPPNYIAFRFNGKLQSIHHIEDYEITDNIHEIIPVLPDKQWDYPHFVYTLGPAIIPGRVIKTGKLYRNGRVWAMLDTLLTYNTIAEARDISKNR